MRKDAEMHAAEDAKRHEEVETRNKADSLAFQVEKTLKDAGDKIAAEKKAPVETALNELKEALKGSDVAAIKAKEEALMKAMEPIAQEMYAQQGAAGAQPGPDAGAGAGTPPPQDGGAKNANDDVVDADYTMK
jgi:molecular chaperone DnaK